MREIVASQSGREVILLQKMDSLILFLNVTEKLRRFLRRNAGGIWIKIHLNPMMKCIGTSWATHTKLQGLHLRIDFKFELYQVECELFLILLKLLFTEGRNKK
jgi:hypothetical protein